MLDEEEIAKTVLISYPELAHSILIESMNIVGPSTQVGAKSVNPRIHQVMRLVSVHERRENLRCDRPPPIGQFPRGRAKSLMCAGIEDVPVPPRDIERGNGKPARTTMPDAFVRARGNCPSDALPGIDE